MTDLKTKVTIRRTTTQEITEEQAADILRAHFGLPREATVVFHTDYYYEGITGVSICHETVEETENPFVRIGE